MKHLKIALTGLAIAGVATGGFLRWYSSSSRLESKALDLYLHGSSRQAYEELVILEHHLPMAHLLLLQAYTLRDSDLMGRSSQRLLQGIQALHESHHALSKKEEQLLLELGLNLALNGYLTQDTSSFDQGLRVAQGASPNSPWIFAMQSLHAQQTRQFILAGQLADQASQRAPLSKWMQKSFSQIFSKHWDQIVHARSLIERGQTVAARALMSQIPKDDTTRSQLRVLSSLINIKEGQSKPLDLSQGYFQLAYANLKSVPRQPDGPFEGDYHEISEAFSKQGQACLNAGLLDGVDFYVGTLSEWHDKENLAPLATSYIAWLAGEELSGSPMPDLSSDIRLNALLHTPEWAEVLSAALIKKLNDALDHKRWDAVEQFWTLTVSSSDSTPKLVSQLQEAVENYVTARFQKLLEEITSTKPIDVIEPSFRDLHQLLPLLAQMESGDGKYQQFLETMVDQADHLLHVVPINVATSQVFGMIVHSTSAPKPDLLLSMVKDRISKRFNQARANHDTVTMAKLFDIAENVGVDAIPSYSSEAIANLIADSRYLLESDQMTKAQNQLRWVLRLEPKNAQARLLLGSSYFSINEFAEAVQLLQSIDKPNNEVRQILAISYLRLGKGEEALTLVDQIKQSGLAIGDRLLMEAALYLIHHKQWREAIDDLQAIRQKVPDVWVYMMASYYKLHDSRGVWQSFNQLPLAMRANHEITALALRSIDSEELWGIASHMMETALALPDEKTIITPTAKEFLQTTFEPFELDLSAAAAHYLQGSQQDPSRALKLLKGMDIGDWRVQTEKALALLQLGLPQQAWHELSLIPSVAKDEDHLIYWLVTLQVLRQTSEFMPCMQLIDSLEKVLNPREEIALERAKLLYDMMRIEECLNTLSPWLQEGTLDSHLLYLDCLVKLGRLDLAMKQANVIAEKDHSAWAVWRTTLIMYPVWKSQNMAWQLPTRNLFELLKPHEKGLVLQAMIAMGESTLAQNWSEQFMQELPSSFEGSLACMQLALMRQNSSEAEHLDAAMLRSSFKNLSQSLRLIAWLEVMGQEALLKEMTASLQDYMPYHGNIENAPTEKVISGCAAQLALARLHRAKDGAIDGGMLRHIEAIRSYCQSLRTDHGPLQYFQLRGEALQILGEYFAAERDLVACIQSCPTSLNAYLRLSEILIDTHNWKTALDTLHTALNLYPGHPWLEFKVAMCEFNKATDSATPQSTDLQPIFSMLEQRVAAIILKAPYLAGPYTLLGRIEIRRQQWGRAYDHLVQAQTLNPTDRDILTLLAAVIEERMRAEGVRMEWQNQLVTIQNRLNRVHP